MHHRAGVQSRFLLLQQLRDRYASHHTAVSTLLALLLLLSVGHVDAAPQRVQLVLQLLCLTLLFDSHVIADHGQRRERRRVRRCGERQSGKVDALEVGVTLWVTLLPTPTSTCPLVSRFDASCCNNPRSKSYASDHGDAGTCVTADRYDGNANASASKVSMR